MLWRALVVGMVLSLGVVPTMARAADGVVTAAADAPSEHDVELVKKRGGGGGGGGGKEWMDYLKGVFTMEGPKLHPKVNEKIVVVWGLGSWLSFIGGPIWLPMIMYGDAPDNDAKKAALMLGIIGTILYWVPGVVPFIIPFIWFYGAGLGVALVWWGVVCGYVIPRAVAEAYSDAYAGGGGGRRRADQDED
ncbi:MAG: hypothetical protein AB2A00_11645 [Myxococcota bacterium]